MKKEFCRSKDMVYLGWIIFVFILALIFGSLMLPVKSHAASFDEALIATSASLPIGADVAAMGGIGTLEDFSSANPAVTGIVSDGNMSGAINYGYFQFEKTRLETVLGSIAKRIGNAVLQVSFAHGETPLKFFSDEEAFRIKKSDTIDFQLGGKVAHRIFLSDDELYLGVGLAINRSEQESIMHVSSVTTTLRHDIMIDSNSNGATIGFAYKPIKKITMGGFGSRTWTKSTTAYNFSSKDESKTSYDIAHLGAAVKIFEGMTIAGDYQHLSFSDSATKIDQYFLGIEQYLIKEKLAVYGGLSNGGLTTGIGIYFKNGGLNLSYGQNIANESRKYFGSCQSFMTSVYFNF